MKRVNESEFVAIIKSAKLTFSSDCFFYDDEENINHCGAFHELSADGINVTFEVGYSHPPYHPTELKISESYDWNFNELKLEVIDDDDEPLDESDIIDLINKHTNIRNIDWSLLGPDECYDLTPNENIDDNNQYEEVTLRRDGDQDLKFKGCLLASHSNGDCYSTTRWTEYELYQTINGLYVCSIINDSLMDIERMRHNAAHFSNLSDIVSFFGINETTKELYEKIGLKLEQLSA
ncbi:hypothetical protein [uncultured Tolumonas sp.]|uniref:hypothetical protein n=1 Tax=uncultured Tolumonas sp. TaxID=263765 RepID=UPI00292EA11F|nr:hypothetical protein [uncultured Tolumonas sp.]